MGFIRSPLLQPKFPLGQFRVVSFAYKQLLLKREGEGQNWFEDGGKGYAREFKFERLGRQKRSMLVSLENLLLTVRRNIKRVLFKSDQAAFS